MGAKLTELRQLISFCRKNGILKFKNENVEFVLSSKALRLPKPRRKVQIDLPQSKEEMDLLLWSSTPTGLGNHA